MFLRGVVTSRAVTAASISLVSTGRLYPIVKRVSGRQEQLHKVRMASDGDKFPAQRQQTQPGKEHAMDPIPEALRQDYKPANKLLVFYFFLFFITSTLCYLASLFKVLIDSRLHLARMKLGSSLSRSLDHDEVCLIQNPNITYDTEMVELVE